ncbi:MAG: hypothetical protein ACR2QS_01595 [Woeseiaceae bacterium]
MFVLIAAAAIFTILGAILLRATLGQLRKGRIVRATGSVAFGAVSAALGVAAVLLCMSYLGYQRLTAEQHVAVIEFAQDGEDVYTARLMLDGQLDRMLPIRGDEWQLDARILTWKPPATILGLDPVYQLERLSGRYSNIERERSEPRTVHSLAEERPLDFWNLAREFPRYTPGIDAFYGTATYLPLADGARFQVTLSRDALIARPVNQQAREAVGDWGLKQE